MTCPLVTPASSTWLAPTALGPAASPIFQVLDGERGRPDPFSLEALPGGSLAEHNEGTRGDCPQPGGLAAHLLLEARGRGEGLAVTLPAGILSVSES